MRSGEFGPGAVVVELDDVRASWPAVRWAAAEAGRRGLDLVIAQSANPGFVVAYPETAVAVAGGYDEVRRLDRLVSGVASEHPGLSVSGIVLEPTPTALSELIDAVQAAVLVVGPGPARFPRSRTERPLVVVNGSARRLGAPSRIVVEVHQDGTCVSALRFAFGFAHRHATAVHVLHAWSGRELPAFGPDCPCEPVSPLVTALADVLTGFPSVPFELALVRGRSTRTLLRRASDAALLVVGEQSAPHRSARRRTRALTRRAVCPVAVVPCRAEGN